MYQSAPAQPAQSGEWRGSKDFKKRGATDLYDAHLYQYLLFSILQTVTNTQIRKYTRSNNKEKSKSTENVLLWTTNKQNTKGENDMVQLLKLQLF